MLFQQNNVIIYYVINQPYISCYVHFISNISKMKINLFIKDITINFHAVSIIIIDFCDFKEETSFLYHIVSDTSLFWMQLNILKALKNILVMIPVRIWKKNQCIFFKNLRKLRLVAMTILYLSFLVISFTRKNISRIIPTVTCYQDQNTFTFIDYFVLVQYDNIILFLTKPVLFSFRMLDSLVTICRNVSPSKTI